MTTFEVSGPHEIPVDRLPNADRVTDDESKKKQFFSNVPHEGGDAIGCYIFAMRTGGGTDPWYVGMTTRGFCKECFQATKTEKYNKIIGKMRGTPLMYFVYRPKQPGQKPTNIIDKLETHLIQIAYNANEDLAEYNQQKLGKKRWNIKGITSGYPNKDAKKLKDVLELG